MAKKPTYGISKGPSTSSVKPGSPMFSAVAPPPAPTPVQTVTTPAQFAPYDPENDPAVQAARAAAASRRTSQLADIAGQRDRLNRDIGISQQGGAVDPNNPYSKLALLAKSFQTAQKANQTRMASQGQLNSGAYQRAQRRASSDFAQGDNQLRTAWLDGQKALDSATARANSDAADADVAALSSYLDRLNALNALVSPQEVQTGGDPQPLAGTVGGGLGIKKGKVVKGGLKGLR